MARTPSPDYSDWIQGDQENFIDYIARLSANRQGGVLGTAGLLDRVMSPNEDETPKKAEASSDPELGLLKVNQGSDGDGSGLATSGKGVSRAENNQFGFMDPSAVSLVGSIFGLPALGMLGASAITGFNNMEALGAAQDAAGLERTSGWDRFGAEADYNLGSKEIGGKEYSATMGGNVLGVERGLFGLGAPDYTNAVTTLTPSEMQRRAQMAEYQQRAVEQSQARMAADAKAALDAANARGGYSSSSGGLAPSGGWNDNSSNGGGFGNAGGYGEHSPSGGAGSGATSGGGGYSGGGGFGGDMSDAGY